MKTRYIDWTIGAIAVFTVLGVMGCIDRADQEQSARVLEESKIAAKADMLNHKREMAALDARARYMTSFDQISYAKAGK